MADLRTKLGSNTELTAERASVAGLIVLMVVAGTIGYSYLEGWTPLEALYTTIITMTTVGYGDFTPQTSAGRIFTIGFGILAIAVGGYAVSSLAAWVIQRQQSRTQHKQQERKMEQLDQLKDHIILCGSGAICAEVARQFKKSETPMILIGTDEASLRLTMLFMEEDFVQQKAEQYHQLGFIPDDSSDVEQLSLADLAADLGILYLLEDPTEDQTLYKAGIGRARGLVTVLDSDRDNLFVVLSARQLSTRLNNAKLEIVARLDEEKNRSKLKAAGADRIVALDLTIGYQISTSLLQPELANFLRKALTGDRRVHFSDIHMREHPDLVGQTIAQVREKHNLLVVAIKRDKEYLYTPDLTMQLQADDLIITIGSTGPSEPAT